MSHIYRSTYLPYTSSIIDPVRYRSSYVEPTTTVTRTTYDEPISYRRSYLEPDTYTTTTRTVYDDVPLRSSRVYTSSPLRDYRSSRVYTSSPLRDYTSSRIYSSPVRSSYRRSAYTSSYFW